jgi:hypothetical protein
MIRMIRRIKISFPSLLSLSPTCQPNQPHLAAERPVKILEIHITKTVPPCHFLLQFTAWTRWKKDFVKNLPTDSLSFGRTFLLPPPPPH